MANDNTAKVEEKVEETVEVYEKPTIREAIAESRPVSFVRRHAKAFVGGAVAVVAAGAAAIVAAKAAGDGAVEVPFDTGAIADAIPSVGEE